jgi:hypothetical protein
VKDRHGHKHGLIVMASDLETVASSDPEAAFIPHAR